MLIYFHFLSFLCAMFPTTAFMLFVIPLSILKVLSLLMENFLLLLFSYNALLMLSVITIIFIYIFYYVQESVKHESLQIDKMH